MLNAMIWEYVKIGQLSSNQQLVSQFVDFCSSVEQI